MLRKRNQKVFFSLLVRKKAQFPNVVHQLQSEFRSIDQLRQTFTLSHSVVLELCMKTFQYKMLNSILTLTPNYLNYVLKQTICFFLLQGLTGNIVSSCH